MRAETAVYRLSFILPASLYDTVPRGPMLPCLHGCLLTVHGAGLVGCDGRPLEVVVEQALRFLRRHRLAKTGAMLDDGQRRTVVQLSTAAGGLKVVAQLDLPFMGADDAA